MDALLQECKDQLEAAERYQELMRDDPYCSWSEKEAMFLGRPLDKGTKLSKSQVFDHRLSTIVHERWARVMSQFPSGKTQATDAPTDRGKAFLMNLVISNYIEPNANAQWDMLTKFRLMGRNGSIYGTSAALVDWRVDDDYIGPDLFMIPIRNLMPQSGAVSIKDADYVFVSSFVSAEWLAKRPDTWKKGEISKLLADIKDGRGKSKSDDDDDNKSYAERQYTDPTSGDKGKYAKIEIVTRYERDRWVTFARDYDYILRDSKNPHESGQIPIVTKLCFPLTDRFWGLGEFERGKTLQYAMNSLVNMYLDGVKFSLFPINIINPKGVRADTLIPRPGAFWQETEKDSIRPLPTNPQGLSTFQSTYSFLAASLLNQAGTTDTAIADNIDPGVGKTPQALKMLQNRENARDNEERFYIERTIQDTYNLMIDLVSKKQDKDIDFSLFKGELARVADVFPDLRGAMEQVPGKVSPSAKYVNVEADDQNEAGRLTIKKGAFTNSKFRFFIDSGSTLKRDQQEGAKNLLELMNIALKAPQIQQAFQMKGKELDISEMFKRVLIDSGVSDWDRIITESPNAGIPPEVMNFQSQDPSIQQAFQQIQQMAGMQPQAMPQMLQGTPNGF